MNGPLVSETGPSQQVKASGEHDLSFHIPVIQPEPTSVVNITWPQVERRPTPVATPPTRRVGRRGRGLDIFSAAMLSHVTFWISLAEETLRALNLDPRVACI